MIDHLLNHRCTLRTRTAGNNSSPLGEEAVTITDTPDMPCAAMQAAVKEQEQDTRASAVAWSVIFAPDVAIDENDEIYACVDENNTTLFSAAQVRGVHKVRSLGGVVHHISVDVREGR